ncbi:uncharacterized protein LOC129564064 [Moschus berezovskii]|uniref:uncharacterized protein LOC129564064 n=1 Tax=Moschus berezovskii TaxID=68408 RepID=UPI0024438F84|nr:uncharacterized protein LOC129564064 [Moschus berezovskii]
MPALKVPVLAHHHPPPVPATGELPKNSCLWPSSWVGCRIPGAVARPGLQILPPQCPAPSSGVLDAEPCPRGRGAQPQRPHRSPGPGGGRPVCARSPPPRCGASSSRAPVPAHLLPVGQAPRPGPAVSSHSPSPPRYPRAPRGAARPGLKCAWSSPPSQPDSQALPITSIPPWPCSPLGVPLLPASPPPNCLLLQVWPRAPRLARHPRAPRTPRPERRAAIFASHRALGRQAEERRRGGGRREGAEGVGRAGELGRRGGGAHQAPRARAPLRRRLPCPRPCHQGAGPGRRARGAPATLGRRRGPRRYPGLWPSEAPRRLRLGRPHPKPARQVAPRSPTP